MIFLFISRIILICHEVDEIKKKQPSLCQIKNYKKSNKKHDLIDLTKYMALTLKIHTQALTVLSRSVCFFSYKITFKTFYLNIIMIFFVGGWFFPIIR